MAGSFADAIARMYGETAGDSPFGGTNQDAIDTTYANLVQKYVTNRDPSAVSTVTVSIPIILALGFTIDVDSPDGSVIDAGGSYPRVYTAKAGTWQVDVAASPNPAGSDPFWRYAVGADYVVDPSYPSVDQTLPDSSGPQSTSLTFTMDDPDGGAYLDIKALAMAGFGVDMVLTMQCTDPRLLTLSGLGLQTREEAMVAKLSTLIDNGLALDFNPLIP